MSKSDFDAFVKRQQPANSKRRHSIQSSSLHNGSVISMTFIRGSRPICKPISRAEPRKSSIAIFRSTGIPSVLTLRGRSLKIGRSIVTFTPIGTMLIGTKGRVDVEGPFGTARLSLVNKQVTSSRQLFRVMITRPDDRPPAAPPSETIKQLEWTWKISPPPPETKFIELSEEAFFGMILAVANS